MEQSKIDVSWTVAELDGFATKYCDATVTASDFLRIFWQRFSAGISNVRCMSALTTKYDYGVSDPKELEGRVGQSQSIHRLTFSLNN